MLTFDVKRKINTLRDILVGKVPDPKAQVEQITIALIYKFMDDMDIEGLEFGGTRQFFTGEYEKYAWTEIMKPENSGQQRALLYAEGIEKMTTNPNLPQLFRDIFRGAYIPYRDPDTLNMFLKEVSDFSYDNSEDLGNAFEYLLSIMGSQGDAGQFRTPRHIIDMMVEIVDPKKNETILDPACGTAGFLISAYRHILSGCSQCSMIVGNYIYCLICPKREDGQAGDSFLQATMYHIIREMQDYAGKVAPIHISVGFSQVKNCELAMAAAQSRTAVLDQFFRGTERVLCYEPGSIRVEPTIVVDHRTATRIHNAMVKGGESLFQELNTILDQLRYGEKRVCYGENLYEILKKILCGRTRNRCVYFAAEDDEGRDRCEKNF